MTGIILFSYDIIGQLKEAFIKTFQFHIYLDFLIYLTIIFNIFNLICKIISFILMLSIYRYLVDLTEGRIYLIILYIAQKSKSISQSGGSENRLNTFVSSGDIINGKKDSFVNIEYYSNKDESIADDKSNHIFNQNFTLLMNRGSSDTRVNIPKLNVIDQEIDVSYSTKKYSPGKIFLIYLKYLSRSFLL